MAKRRGMKRLLTAIALTLMLAVPLVILAADPYDPVRPKLSFEGAEIQVHKDADGQRSLQLLFKVYVKNTANSDGAKFALRCNEKYLVPSSHETNEPLSVGSGAASVAPFFKVDPELYKVGGVSQNPFAAGEMKESYIGIDSAKNERVAALSLFTKKQGLQPGGKIKRVDAGGEGEPSDYFYVFDSSINPVALGTVSFRVTNPELLPEIVANFKGIINQEDPKAVPTPPNGERLIWVPTVFASDKSDIWGVGACLDVGTSSSRHFVFDPTTMEMPAQGYYKPKALFTFAFSKTLMKVEPAEPTLSLDAYRAFSNGTAGDVAAAMQKYSPAVTATYSDGSQEAFILPWDGCTVKDLSGTVITNANYDPTHGSYKIEQDFWYQNAEGTRVKFPVPVKAELTVTPIELKAVTADDLHRTYPLNNELVGEKGVRTRAQMHLPTEARLVTDIPAGGASLVMDIPGWTPTKAGSAWPAAGAPMSTLLADEPNPGNKIHWPTPADADNWTTVGGERAGTYSFTMADAAGNPKAFTAAEIRTAYRWLTVPDGNYGLTAERVLKDAGALIDKSRYHVKYTETKTLTGNDPELALRVYRTVSGGGTAVENMPEGAAFRVTLPDGTEMDGWFTGTTGEFTATRADVRSEDGGLGEKGYELKTSPGDVGTGNYQVERERLRRYLNLGGWFAVSINEDPATLVWSDFIPVYVPPRPNLHTGNKTYNFIGPNRDLFGWPGTPGTIVTLPKGAYWPVSDVGVRAPVGVSERYGVPTTYDGATGGQPGELNTFRVDGWTVTPEASPVGAVTRRGPNLFVDGARYGAYGEVFNPNPDKKTATLRTQRGAASAQTESITLTAPAGTSGISYSGVNVSLVTYDARTVGYRVRQDVQLTITNTGSTDLYDLNVDTVTGGGHFILLKPPAAFLPAGASTTFTLSYRYDMPARTAPNLDYRDTLYITSSSHPTPGLGNDNLLNFDAQFRVSAEDLHRVRVIVEPNPADANMGSAGVIVGQTTNGAGETIMNTAAATPAFKTGETVYILAQPEDEYDVEAITGVDGWGVAITPIPSYTGPAKVPEGVKVYSFIMPDADATITVKFYEPIRSKLRLSDMKVYADKETANLKPDKPNPAPYTIWQKKFTEQELKDAYDPAKTPEGKEREYLMTCGAADKAGLTVPGLDKAIDQYLVVLPVDADYAQVEVTLRELAIKLNNADIAPTVSMTLFKGSPVTPAPGSTEAIMDPPQTGNTAAPPTTHYSKAFPSPMHGTSEYVRVDLYYKEPLTTVETTRSYYLELHRAPKDVAVTLDYGNSPYGMIMHAPNITDKAKAKAAFKANGFRFKGAAADLKPAVVNAALAERYYWREAWVEDVNDLYDPESGINPVKRTVGGIDYHAYEEVNNLDLSDTAFFAIFGQDFVDPGILAAEDSSGRPAKIEDAVISLTALKLVDLAPSQLARFAGPASAAEETARTVTLALGDAGGTVSAASWGSADLRPGRYRLAYTFPDYNGTSTLTVYRDFVLLAPIGDENADRTVTTADETAVKKRMTAPLGYMAENYPHANIFKFRTCTVNNDRNVNNIDANAIRAAVRDGTGLGTFYLPVGYK